jgi:hypothetical protein
MSAGAPGPVGCGVVEVGRSASDASPDTDPPASLQQALAARYGSNPALPEVTVSSCTTLTAEPFVMAPATVALATADG